MSLHLSDSDKRTLERLRTDLRFFCAKELKIKLKGGGMGSFVWNRAQEYLHQRIEEQLARTGMVRMFILKGRQQGISTYIAARFLHKAMFNLGIRVFILSHHSSTTGTLFQIVDTYFKGVSEPVKPDEILNNNRQMVLDNGSQYTVGTAGTGSIARGDTTQLFHWSEVAFSENIGALLTGAVQTVADVPGTELLNESTANGIGNFFHRGCMAALAGQAVSLNDGDGGEDSDQTALPYELVFIPWYWQPEYYAPVRPNFRPDEYESELMQMYGLVPEQIQWRRNKIAFFQLEGLNGDRKFKQEYPFTVQEAFQASGTSLIDPELIDRARKAKMPLQDAAPYSVGVDPARNGDRTVFTHRRGRHIFKVEVFTQQTEMTLAGKIANLIDRASPDMVFVDITGGTGNGAVDRLNELGYRRSVTGVQFSSKADDPRYLNKRAEMAGLLREWFTDEGGCQIPDDEQLGVEYAMIPDFIETSKGLLQLVSKDKIKEIYGRSPDLFDSAKLTFAFPVRKTHRDLTSRRTTGWATRSQLEANKGRNIDQEERRPGEGIRRR